MTKDKTPTDLIQEIVDSSKDCDVDMMNRLIATSMATTTILEAIRDLKQVEEDIIDKEEFANIEDYDQENGYY